MKYYLIAGEASGDLHGANLMKGLKAEDVDARFRYFGGDLMHSVDGELAKHFRDTAFFGILNVVLNLKTIKKSIDLCKKDIISFQPDVLILIDYPGFNLRMAEFANKKGIKVFYYISPKIWAWKEHRVKKIRKYVDEMFTILPFETEFYQKHKIEVNYVGNPLMDSIHSFGEKPLPKEEFIKQNNLDKRPVVALLCGSRVQEIKNTLPVMIQVIRGIFDFQFVVAGVNSVDRQLYEKILKDENIKIVFNQTYNLLNNSHTALVTSGTAALETALFNVPQTIMYRVEGGWLVDVLMRNIFLKVKWVSLPNLILNKEAVKEYIQVDLTVKNIKRELNLLLYGKAYRQKIFDDYSRLKQLMGEAGSSMRAAKKMVELLKQK